MKELIQLLYHAKKIQKLMKQKEEQNLKESLKIELEQEEKILEKLEFADLVEIESFLNEILEENYESFSLPFVVKRKDTEPYVFRTLRKVKEKKEILEMQECSFLSRKEMENIFSNPYIEEIEQKIAIQDTFERKIKENYLKKQPEDTLRLQCIYVDSMLDLAPTSKDILNEKEYELLYEEQQDALESKIKEEIKFLLETMDKEEKQEYQDLLKTYLEETPESIKFSLGDYCGRIIGEKENVRQLLEEYGLDLEPSKEGYQETFFLDLKEEENFTYEEFITYDSFYQALFRNCHKLWILFQVLIERKGKKEERKEIEETIKKHLKEEERILKEVEDLKRFKSYIKNIYGEEEIILPTFFLSIALANQTPLDLERQQLTNMLLNQRVIQTILNKKEKKETYDEDGDLIELDTYDAETLERFMRITARKTLHLITEEEYKEELEKFGILYDQEKEECEKEYFQKFFQKVNATFQNNLKSLCQTLDQEERNVLELVFYIPYFVKDLKKFVEEKFEPEDYLEDGNVDTKSSFYKTAVEVLKQIIIEELEDEKEEELYPLLLELYIDSTEGILKEKDKQQLQELFFETEEQQLKRTKRP